ncbi:MAG: ribulose-phosphate 3-epimerase [Bacilli bacterium]|nr:ribulose-phosphate 3-epimerase [Bacilli bacterium]
MIKISPSILASKDRIESIKKLNNTNADYLHIDTMDGLFVPNTQMPLEEILELEKHSKLPLDIHLMVEDPEKYINYLENKNIEYITIHIEIDKDIDYLINKIKSLNYKVGLSIKPNTEVSKLIPYLDKIDLVLIMSVEPGFGGQEFMPDSLEKAKYLRNINKDIILEIDGGIKDTNIDEVKKHVDIAVVGSYITNSTDYNEAINKLKN